MKETPQSYYEGASSMRHWLPAVGRSELRQRRSVGRVFLGTLDVNAEMVRRGFAWWYRSYAKKDTGLASAETEAKNAGRGLWADKAPVQPWEFRKSQTTSRKTAVKCSY